MVVIGERTLQCMSVVIGVCGTNFCTLLSDGRRVTNVNGGGIEPIDEDFQKIFRINPRVLVGVGGWFDRSEGALDALSELTDLEHASAKIVKNAVVSYCNAHRGKFPSVRTYIICGKQHDGSFIMYEVKYNVAEGETTVTERKPDKHHNFGLSMALPYLPKEIQQNILAYGSKVIIGSRTHEEMVTHMSDLIKEIAKREDSVNDNIKTLSVF